MVSCYTSGWGHFPKTPFGRSTISTWLANEEVLLRRISELQEDEEESYEGRGYGQNDSSQNNEAEMEDGMGQDGVEPNPE